MSEKLFFVCCLCIGWLLVTPTKAQPAEPEAADSGPDSLVVPAPLQEFLWHVPESEFYRIELIVFRWKNPNFSQEIMDLATPLVWGDRLLDLAEGSGSIRLNLPPAATLKLPDFIHRVQWPDFISLLEAMEVQRQQFHTKNPDKERTATRPSDCAMQKALLFRSFNLKGHGLSCPGSEARPPPPGTGAAIVAKKTKQPVQTSLFIVTVEGFEVDTSRPEPLPVPEKPVFLLPPSPTLSTPPVVLPPAIAVATPVEAPEKAETEDDAVPALSPLEPPAASTAPSGPAAIDTTAPPPQQDAAGSWPPPLADRLFFRLSLKASNALLATVAERIGASRTTELLMHTGWVQTLGPREQSPHVHLSLKGGEGFPLLQGKFWPWRQRFLHLETDLRQQHWRPLSLQPTIPLNSNEIPDANSPTTPVEDETSDPLGTGAWRNFLDRLKITAQTPPRGGNWRIWLHSVPPPVDPQSLPEDEDTISGIPPVATVAEDSKEPPAPPPAAFIQRAVQAGLEPPDTAPAPPQKTPFLAPLRLQDSSSDEDAATTSAEKDRLVVPLLPARMRPPPPLPAGIHWPADFFHHHRLEDGFTLSWRKLSSIQSLDRLLQQLADSRTAAREAFLIESFAITEERKVEQEEVHYFDHPAFGLVATMVTISAEDYALLLAQQAQEQGVSP